MEYSYLRRTCSEIPSRDFGIVEDGRKIQETKEEKAEKTSKPIRQGKCSEGSI